MKRLFREPLLHFVLLGIALFGVDGLLRQRTVEAGGGDIVVSRGRIETLATLFAKTWHRPPTPEELRGLIDDFVLEEALYREGIALGVDKGDTIIRRRLRQKMEFLARDVIALAEPTQSELEAWLAEHPTSYASPETFSFLQVYLSADRRGKDLRSDAEQLLAELQAAESAMDPAELGDASLLEHSVRDADANFVASTFGPDFAARLLELPTGAWSGPVESAFGLHLVRVDSRTEGSLPPLSEVREAVERDWSFARYEEETKRFYEDVVSRYRVAIDWTPDASEAENVDPTGTKP